MVVVLFILTLTTDWWISLIALVTVCVLLALILLRRCRSRRKRQNVILLSILGLLAGVVVIFATDFIFDNVLQDHQRKRIEVLLGIKEDPSGV